LVVNTIHDDNTSSENSSQSLKEEHKTATG